MSQVAELQARLEELQSRMDSSTKDLSLLNLVPKWAGTEKSGPLHEFLTAVENMADMGNWSERDKVRIATMRLEDAARTYVAAAPEFRGPSVTWENFKTALLQRFRDTRTDNFHYSQLHSAKQKADETVLAFSDRVRMLGRAIAPTEAEPAVQRACNAMVDKMVLAAFKEGLRGKPGDQTRFGGPATLEEAIRIAVTVEQAEACRPKPDAFYLEKERKGEKPFGKKKGEGKDGKFDSSRRRSSPFQRDRRGRDSGQRPESKATSDTRCYNCSGYGHFARVCPTRVDESQGRDKRSEQRRQGPTNPPRERQPYRKDYRAAEAERKQSGNC
jgi:hypothetical protein